jgi:hypothetical protein
MDPVGRLDQVLQLIGRQMAERASRLDAGTLAPSPAAVTRPSRRAAVGELKEKVRGRLRALDPNDPGRQQKARRVFLESVLSWQFGDELLLDRGFEEMIAGVQEALQSHPGLEQRLAQLLRDLAR